MRKRRAGAAREDPAKVRGVGLGAAVVGAAIVWTARALLQ